MFSVLITILKCICVLIFQKKSRGGSCPRRMDVKRTTWLPSVAFEMPTTMFFAMEKMICETKQQQRVVFTSGKHLLGDNVNYCERQRCPTQHCGPLFRRHLSVDSNLLASGESKDCQVEEECNRSKRQISFR